MLNLTLPTKKRIDNYLEKHDQNKIFEDINGAQEIMYDIWESNDIFEVEKLLKRVFRKSPLCADAYTFYCTTFLKDEWDKRAYLETAVYAAEKALNEPLKNFEGHCWGFFETRPYMRARAALAMSLWEIGDYLAAIRHLEEMLVLNPNDNQGLRDNLATYYLELEQMNALEKLFNQYEDDYSTLLYTKALVSYKQSLDSAEALAKEAIARNEHVPYLLKERKKELLLTDMLLVGGRDEAIDYINNNLLAWMRAEGAIDWLVNISDQSSDK